MNSQNEKLSFDTVKQLVDEYSIQGKLEQGFRVANIYVYNNKLGTPIYWRARLEKDDKKIVLPIRQDGVGDYSLKEPDFPSTGKVLYHLDVLINNPENIVYVVEGEKCADMLINLGLIATTSGSSSSASKADWSVLQNRDILIWRDNDDAGLRYAKAVTEQLIKINCKIKWVDITKLGLPKGGDCVDWFAQHHDNTSEKQIEQLPLINPEYINDKIESNSVRSQYPRFELLDNGVYFCKDVNDELWISSWLKVKALTRDKESSNWGRVLEFIDADNVTHEWTMPMEMLSSNGEELAKELQRLGLRIAPGAPMRKFLVEYITNSDTKDRARCVLQTGWSQDCFVLPNKVYGVSDEMVLLQSDISASLGYFCSNSHEEWLNNISRYCIGNSRLAFAISLALAAPLLRLLGIEGGGFHVRGSSSIGKTTLLQIAASVWGGAAFMHNWRATDNGIEGLAAVHNDSLLILDELAQVDPRYAGEVAYMLANGQGKARASKAGSIRDRRKWRLMFLSSGEISLASHMLNAGKRVKAGQEVRMIDLPADAGSGMGIFETLHDFDSAISFAEFLKSASEKYFGLASDIFLDRLVAYDRATLHKKMQTIQLEFMSLFPKDAHGQLKRVAMRFALVALAGELATEFSITGWVEGEALRASINCFNAWRKSSDKDERSSEVQDTIEHVRHFFLENASRFDAGDCPHDYERRHIPLKCAGFKMNDGYYVFPTTFNQEICKDLGSPKEVRKICIECGWLIPDGTSKNDSKPVYVPTQGKTIRLYHFSREIISENQSD